MKRELDRKTRDLIARGMRNAGVAYRRVMRNAQVYAERAAGDAWDKTIRADFAHRRRRR